MHQTIHTVVFEEKPGGGNPAPVTLDADRLSAEEMQAMAFRFGEESVFLMKPARGDCDVKARYFVPLHEMEMCTHDTIAAVTVLVKTGRAKSSPVRLETALGRRPCQSLAFTVSAPLYGCKPHKGRDLRCPAHHRRQAGGSAH